MSSDSYRPAVTRFVEAATDIANRLDFTVEMPCRQFVLAGRLRQLDRLWMDLTASTAAVGRDGVAVARAAQAVGDALAAAVEAHDADDFKPWHRGQDTVREQLDVLRRLAHANRRAQHVSVKMAPAASPTAAPVAAVSEQTNSQKGERGESVPADSTTTVVLDQHERRMLKTLLENDAISEADGSRLLQGDVMSFGGMTAHAVRQAAKSLYQKGLVNRFDDRRGGYWLKPRGIAVANSLAQEPKK